MTPRRRSPGAYARAVERAWIRLCGRPVILSPREGELILDWYDRRIPLQVVLEAIEEAAGRRREAPPRSLSYVAPAVEEGWRVVVDGRLSADAATGGGAGPAVRGAGAWRERAEREPPGSPLRVLIEELLGALRAGEEAEAVDARLEKRLAEAVDDGLRAAVEQEVIGELAPHRGRMEPAVFSATLRRGVTRRLRIRLALPALDPN